MRSDQRRRVQFEMAGGIGSHIGGGRDRLYPVVRPQQQAAHLMIIGGRQGHDLFQQNP